jgi:hypothetical protein
MMKMMHRLFTVLTLLYVSGLVVAERQLERDEILQMFRVLTDQPRDTWIQKGVIRAEHLEYKASTELIIDSTVTIRYDGNRFYWEINIDSCSAEQEISERVSRDRIDLERNARRVFIWDGQKYTMYFRPGNHVIVTEDTSDMPVLVNGPLTAGLVPWGIGVYTYERLSAAQVSAVERQEGGRDEIRLTINMSGMPQMTMVLDPGKNYAVLSNNMTYAGQSFTLKTCSDYRLISDRWVPGTMEIEKYDDSKPSPTLIAYDSWRITSIDAGIADAAPFSVDYESNAFVEHYTDMSKKPLSYYCSPEVDTESLHRKRIEIAASQKTETQNCATAAVKYVASKLGKDVTQQQLAALVNANNRTTNLHAVKELVSGMNLNCLAVRTDVQTLANLTDCCAILHLPGEKHFVVLDHVDDVSVWLIDLDRDRFYFPVRRDAFKLDWPVGTALVVSRQSIQLQSGMKEIGDDDLKRIVGADSFGTYSCTQLLQDATTVFCSETVSGFCQGRYRQYFKRYGCELAEQGGSCYGSALVGSIWCSCVENMAWPGECASDGVFYEQVIRACQ